MSSVDLIPERGGRREMPHNADAERGLLGSMLQDPDVIDSCAGMDAEAFYVPAHRVIFERVREMRLKLKPVDFITLTQDLTVAGSLEAVGGAEVVTDLFTFVPSAVNWDYYASIVRDCHLLRRVIAGCTLSIQEAYAQAEGAEQILNNVEQRVMEVRGDSGKSQQSMKPVREFVMDAVTSLESVYANRGKPIGLETGIPDLDRMTGGLKKTLLYVIAGRPSMGKTVLGVQMAVHNALNGVPVALFSLEMSGAELAERMIATRCGINLQRWRDGFMNHGDLPRVTSGANDLAKATMWIDETPQLSIMELRARARRARSKLGVRLIVIDYLQLMRAPSKKADFSRAAEVADISMGLKAMAKELNIPVIVLAQLNRDAEEKRRPALSHLRESGQIEQDADVAILIHRPWKDKEKSPAEREEHEAEGEPAEAILAKQRNGPIGDIPLRFFGAFTRFDPETKKRYSNNNDERQKNR